MDKAIVTPILSPASFSLMMLVLLTTLLSGCVTQNYENDTPVVQNQANRDEMAATRISLGLGYLKMGNMTQAKLNLEKAKRFSPDLVQVHTAFAHYFEVVGENELTSQSYEKALSIKADDADTLNNYGVFLCRQNEIVAAEIQFLKAIAVPSYLLVAQSYENLASCFLQIDDFNKAEKYLNKAINHSPNRSETLLQMVRLQYAMADYGQAKIYQQKFERNTRRFTPDFLALAYKVYRKLGQRRTAKNYGTMLVKMYPQSWESKQYLLNELALIEADNLAKRYQLTQRQLKKVLPPTSTKSKKRIVKLSPKSKAKASAIASLAAINAANSSLDSNKIKLSKMTENTGKALTHVNLADSVKNRAQIQTIAEPEGKLVVLVSDKDILPTASATAISAALVNELSTDTEKNIALTLTEEDNAVDGNIVEVDTAVNSGFNDILTGAILVSAETKEIRTEIDSLTGTLTHISSEANFEALSETATRESNSTMPMPAKRDTPLPEEYTVLLDAEKTGLEVKQIAHISSQNDIKNTDETTKTDFVQGEVQVTEVSPEEKVEVTPSQSLDKTTALVFDEEIASRETIAVENQSKKASLNEDQVIENITLEVQLEANTSEQKNALSASNNSLAAEQAIIYHQVLDGDTLYAISVKYNVKIRALRKWNKMSAKHKLQRNKKIYVTNPDTVTNIND